MNCHEWVYRAAEYARSVADNVTKYGYVRGPQGGWVWEDKSTEEKENDNESRRS